MKKRYYSTVAFLIILFSSGYLFAQPEDDGMTNDFHKKNITKAVFAKSAIFQNREERSGITNEFIWGEPIYAMYYFAKGMNNEYHNLGWDYSGKTYYLTEVYANGKLIGSLVQEIDKKWTNIQASFYPKANDNYNWLEKTILPSNTASLVTGKNSVNVKVYPSNPDGSQKGSVVCEGSFMLDYAPKAESTDKAPEVKTPLKPVITGFKTRFNSDDSRNEWIITMNQGTGVLKTRFSGADDWNEWKLQLTDYDAIIKTRFNGSDGWKEWFYEDAVDKIVIKTRYTSSDGWQEWQVSSTSASYTVKTRFSGNAGWHEWIIFSTTGKITVKTRWSDENSWREWYIYDEMPDEPTNMKLASIFPCIFASAYLVR